MTRFARIASVALALVLIYRTTGLLNFAQGEMALFSTFITFQFTEAGLGIWLGSLVDHHPKKLVMLGSSAVSFSLYALSLGLLLLAPEGAMRDVASVWLWAFVLTVMVGVTATDA